MEQLLYELTAHNFQNRAFSIMESGSWSPQSGKLMREKLSAFKGMREVGTGVSFLSSVKESTKEELKNLATEIARDIQK